MVSGNANIFHLAWWNWTIASQHLLFTRQAISLHSARVCMKKILNSCTASLLIWQVGIFRMVTIDTAKHSYWLVNIDHAIIINQRPASISSYPHLAHVFQKPENPENNPCRHGENMHRSSIRQVWDQTRDTRAIRCQCYDVSLISLYYFYLNISVLWVSFYQEVTWRGSRSIPCRLSCPQPLQFSMSLLDILSRMSAYHLKQNPPKARPSCCTVYSWRWIPMSKRVILSSLTMHATLRTLRDSQLFFSPHTANVSQSCRISFTISGGSGHFSPQRSVSCHLKIGTLSWQLFPWVPLDPCNWTMHNLFSSWFTSILRCL